VKTGGSSTSVFRCGIFPRSAILLLLEPLPEDAAAGVDSLCLLGSDTNTNRLSSL
jgi:hypothetical protein